MCAIVGIYNFAKKNKVDPGLMKKMCRVLKHRGPDDEGIYCKNNLGLGHRRLSIIDLTGGHQPMSNDEGTLWIVFNGEIYNFQELREYLLTKGYRFKTRSDTEVILHLYEEEKEECLKKLNGMFAFAIWDEKERKLFLARDRVGIKPLHYAVFDGKLVFASEIKAILQDPSFKREIDFEALHDYLSLMYVPAPKTMFNGIKKLSAGHYLICTEDKIEVRQYWDIDFSNPISGTENEICENLYTELLNAVKAELVSDVPLGTFLSGGIDSSSIVSLMSQLNGHRVITNSIGFTQKAFDELSYARIVAKRFSTDHHEYIVEPKALDILDKLVGLYDEPFGDASAIPTYYVSQMARQNVKVVLSGDGGDENFAGYRRYRYSQHLMKLRNSIPFSMAPLIRRASQELAGLNSNMWAIKIKCKLDELYLDLFDLYFKLISIFKEEEKPLLYTDLLKKKMKFYTTQDNYRRIFNQCSSEDGLSRLQYLDIKTYLCDDILVKVDRASMAHSLEVRVPILNYRLMEYAASIPSSLKLKNGSGKYILKKAMARHLENKTLERSKKGFEVPLDFWLGNELRKAVEEEIFQKDGIIRELFDMEYIRRVWSFVLNGHSIGFKKTDFSYRIWLLFLFSRWHKKYIAS